MTRSFKPVQVTKHSDRQNTGYVVHVTCNPETDDVNCRVRTRVVGGESNRSYVVRSLVRNHPEKQPGEFHLGPIAPQTSRRQE